MESLTEFSKYGSTGVALALIGAGVYVFRTLLPLIKQLIENLGQNTEVAKQTYKYLKLRNGRTDEALRQVVARLEKMDKADEVKRHGKTAR